MSSSETIAEKCSGCGKSECYESVAPVSATGAYAPSFLPGLGTWYRSPTFRVVVCAACGLIRFFAEQSELQALAESDDWRRV